MNIDSKQSNLDRKPVETHGVSDKKKDLLETLNLENPRIKGEIKYNGETALLIKHDKKYEELKYSCYSILYKGKIYEIGGVKNCIINGITKEGIIVSYCNRVGGGGSVKWSSGVFDGEKLNKFPYKVHEIVTLGKGKDALICEDNGMQYALYDGFKSPNFDLIERVELFDGKLATIGRIDERLLVSVGDKVYGEGEGWKSVELVGGHSNPRIEWTKKGTMLIN